MHNIISVLHWPARKIDALGMYRVVSLALLFLVVCSLGFGAVGMAAYPIDEQLMSLAAVLAAAFGANVLCAKLFKVHANHESAFITALILFFLFTPAFDVIGLYVIAVAAVIAMASKYLIAPRRQHIFNAAALGAAVLSVPGWHEAWWWVASPELFVPLLLAGAVVVHKVRKWTMVAAFLATAISVLILERGEVSYELLQRFFITGPALFLGIFMLTEPFTTPPRYGQQIAYAVVVGGLMSTTAFASLFAMTPELALLIGNLVFYPATLRRKLFLEFRSKSKIAADTYEFIFAKPEEMRFLPGQYLEWMLPHSSVDSRGERRYFTIASAPEEEYLRLALKIMPEKGSSYKKELMAMKSGDKLIASQLAGDFLLPKDVDEKCAFVAGGIGVTPFRSFVGHMLVTEIERDAVLYYACNYEKDLAYKEYFERAHTTFGFRVVNVLAKEEKAGSEHGFLNAAMIEKHTPDFKERTWYLSGPPPMVNAYKRLLLTMGVPRRKIVTDFFPGLA